MKHQNHDVIVAWVEGKDVQFRHKDINAENVWVDWETLVINGRVSGMPDFSNNNLIWRIKPNEPEHKYRVALFYNTQNKAFFTNTLDSNAYLSEKGFMDMWDIGYTRFVRWLTDWVEVNK